MFLVLFLSIQFEGAFGAKGLKKCVNGVFGLGCQTKCNYPWFGDDCRYQCHCSVESCHHTIGCYIPENNCPAGYIGKFCEQQCPFPNYGYGCQQTCLCSELNCNSSTGCTFKQNNARHPNEESDLPVMHEPMSTKGHGSTAVFTLRTITKDKDVPQKKNSTTTESIRGIGNEHSTNASTDEIKLKSNKPSLEFSGDLNANASRDTFFNWIKKSWLNICILFFGVGLSALVILHFIVSVVNFVKMKRSNREDEIV